MKGIKHLFFDLDHTLWDYSKSSRETLEEIHEQMDLASQGVSSKKFSTTFYRVNEDFWHRYNNGQIDRFVIKNERFRVLFDLLELEGEHEASEYFMKTCSSKPYLMEDALTVLRYLQPKYKLHIITNGFEDVQRIKLAKSGIIDFFETVTTSDLADARKPFPEIFEFALDLSKAAVEESIMIGDNSKTDVKGAQDFGMKAVFYDPSGARRSTADFTVQSHLELLRLF